MLMIVAAILALASGAAALPLIFQVEIILWAYRISDQNPIIASVLITGVMAAPYFIACATATAAIIVIADRAGRPAQHR